MNSREYMGNTWHSNNTFLMYELQRRNYKVADIVTVNNLVKNYGDLCAVDHLSFTVSRGATIIYTSHYLNR